jgi:hypothetical protein
MKILIQAAVVTLFAASTAQAQQAVQWKVSDGGNGHWYQLVVDPTGLTWTVARQRAIAVGGDLAVLSRQGSTEFVQAMLSGAMCGGSTGQAGPYVGGFQDLAAPDYSEPSGGWRWVDGSPFPGSAAISLDDNLGHQDYVHFISLQPSCSGPFVLDDVGLVFNANRSFIIEWSADCNGDEIVDYGQCLDGTLPDYNGNKIPDCCERGEACMVGSYPVEWRVEDGGNGHWYRFVPDTTITWAASRERSILLGGDLATVTSASEQEFLFAMIAAAGSGWSGGWWGPFIGATRRDLPNWQWVSGEPWDYQRWGPGEPNNDSGGSGPEDRLTLLNAGAGGSWNDVTELACAGSSCEYRTSSGFVIEWSADCNNDGIVDYGQILQGELADLNTDGVPDICQQPTCVDADIFRDFNVNGADLGILLSQWGPASAGAVSDLNRDGQVNGADLGFLLASWGSCTN